MNEIPDLNNTGEFLNEMKEVTAFEEIKTEFSGRIATLIIAALSLVSALAWDEALKDIFSHFFGDLTTLEKKIGYAVTVTLVAVLISVVVRKIYIKKRKKILNIV